VKDPVLRIQPLGFPWITRDPFLFCVFHEDDYPAGDDRMAPVASLDGRDLGMDFAGKDGWRMYHGETVPGFPAHPHRGFETVTIVRRGLVDHSDSLGAAARYGGGDVQWLTAGRGIQHSEMFPLVSKDGGNPLELFQIWLNLPAASKLADPNFTMFWRDAIPRHVAPGVDVTVIAGALAEVRPLAPPPSSWAARDDADVAIWTIALEPGASWTLPPAAAGTNRSIYVFRGEGVRVGDHAVPTGRAVDLAPDASVPLVNGSARSEILLLQGRPIAEPVAQHGPFVMNTRNEIMQAFADYQRTRFGGWPWDASDPVHPRTEGRFARHADGRIEKAE
jgi:quercetin 2,3-dioxygenase